ncbi:MAG: Cystathionine beta-lyase MetC [Syntrophorhabdus sp. PtaU1.Bin050]|nr:MAG: Cystathionine beta-lyase MetC [Syntrophorhabdus sp. PtaU1.Bin050]
MEYRTKIVHTGRDKDPYTGAASIPIYQVSTFVQDEDALIKDYRYSRASNPTREALEHTIAVMENGTMGFAFSSGMAATSTVLLLLKPGDHIIAPTDVYGGTYRALTSIFQRWGLKHTFVDMTDIDAINSALRPDTRAIFVETPSNPLLKITDLRAIVDIARDRGILTIIDNTFMTPYLQRPLEFGFDIVVHSATKFIGGHSDVIAGLAVTRSEELGNALRDVQISFGAVLGPQDSWLLLRGIKTLGVRMDAQQKTAESLALWLAGCADVKHVFYPALEGHPGRDVHLGQSDGGGAVLSFELPDGRFARDFMAELRLCLFAVSLGGVESILSYPSMMSHAAIPEKERVARGITDGLVRLSVGLEDEEDLRADIEQALAKARR